LFLNSNVNTKYFCGAGFSSSMVIDEAMLDVSKDHGSWSINGGNQVTF
jgi:galactitol-specific phosphotransferase system IIB component